MTFSLNQWVQKCFVRCCLYRFVGIADDAVAISKYILMIAWKTHTLKLKTYFPLPFVSHRDAPPPSLNSNLETLFFGSSDRLGSVFFFFTAVPLHASICYIYAQCTTMRLSVLCCMLKKVKWLSSFCLSIQAYENGVYVLHAPMHFTLVKLFNL